MSVTEVQNFPEQTSDQAFLIDLDDLYDNKKTLRDPQTDVDRSQHVMDTDDGEDISVDMSQDSDKGHKLVMKASAERKNSKKDAPSPEPNINLFTCYIGPCPEVVNANFKHPEFMICYRDANSRCDNSMMRYYCCPLYLTSIEKDGEETFELRAVPMESGTDSNENFFAQQEEQWRKYYSQGAQQAPHGLGAHFSNFRHLPHQFHFLHRYSCSCPPHMGYYASQPVNQPNYHCHRHSHSQQNFRSFAYQNYVFSG